jgi:acetate kinase
MTNLSDRRVLAINTGSSSLKAALYQISETQLLVLSLEVSRIGAADSHMRITDAGGAALFDRHAPVSDQDAALQAAFDWLRQHDYLGQLHCVGHRVVHGGSRYCEPQLVTPELMAALQEWAPLVPDHLPQAIGAIQFVSRLFPVLRQMVCFDTAFHRRMPNASRRYALPRHFMDEGLKRFGFHGLSYEYVAQELRTLDGKLADGRVIVAHLGSGSSMAAIQGGTSIDTTMGFTPASGLVMGKRCGDIDPEAILYLIEQRKMTAQAVNTLINRQSGLFGVSGASDDVRELLDQESTNAHAAEALELFCYRAKKYLGAYVAVLGGLDILVFTGGIGMHASAIRQRICAGLECLGIVLDSARNRDNAPVISAEASTPGSRVKVRVLKTDEELIIARHAVKLLS